MVLSAAADRRLQPVQLQKILFLLDRLGPPKSGDQKNYNFEPYHYGPFDRQVYSDLSLASDEGLVERVPSDAYPGHDFQLTPRGLERAEFVLNSLRQEQREVLRDVVRWVTSMSFRELLGAIYKRFPEFRENSIFYS
jgi:uncharacterized protein YwgA